MAARTFIVGDIHGCALTLQRLLFEELRLTRHDRLYLLGDLIDRGPRSREALETILRLISAGYTINAVRGNHEEMLLNACRNRDFFSLWIENGGKATLQSFGVEDACEIPQRYIQFLSSFPYYIQLKEFVLCHAGLNCLAPDPLSDTDSMLWGRDLPVIPERLGGRRVICGHTVLPFPKIAAGLSSNRIILDGGCVFTGREGFGNLVALELETMALYKTSNCDL